MNSQSKRTAPSSSVPSKPTNESRAERVARLQRQFDEIAKGMSGIQFPADFPEPPEGEGDSQTSDTSTNGK